MTARERTSKYLMQGIVIILIVCVISIFALTMVHELPSSWYKNWNTYMEIQQWQYQRDINTGMLAGLIIGALFVGAIWLMWGTIPLQKEQVKEDREKLKQEILAELKKK